MWLALGVGALMLALSFCIRPDVNPGHDATFYLDAAVGFVAHGTDHPYFREPIFPALLALLMTLRLPVERCLPPLQNVAFCAALYVYLSTFCAARIDSRARRWLCALAITAVPTFFVLMNGAVYAEGVLATLVLLLHCALGQAWRAARNGQSGRAMLWAAPVFGLSAALGLTKGSFVIIHEVLALLLVATVIICAVLRNGRRWPLKAALVVALALGSGGALAQRGWFAIQQHNIATPLKIYERGGMVLFGRTEFARRFDFATDSVPYVTCALSESVFRRMYQRDPAAYTFQAENALGQAQIDAGVPEEELFRRGLAAIREEPVRQFGFAPFELSRFVFHHGVTGFATLEVPVLSAMLYSSAMSVLLKAFNLALYLFPLVATWIYFRRLRRERMTSGDAWRAWPDALRAGVVIAVVYCGGYVGVYGFATTVVRMVYPLAPLLVVANVVLALEMTAGIKKSDNIRA